MPSMTRVNYARFTWVTEHNPSSPKVYLNCPDVLDLSDYTHSIYMYKLSTYRRVIQYLYLSIYYIIIVDIRVLRLKAGAANHKLQII